jgi:arabinofuranan 3-O-arabinosyltransferase
VAGVSVREVEVRAGDQRVRTEANPVTGRATVTLDGSEVRTLRVTVTRTLGDPDEGVVAIREVDFVGRLPSETLVMPDAGADDATTLLLRGSPSRTTCLEADRDTVCRPLEARPGEAEARLSRQVTLAAGGRWKIRGTVVARPTAATRRLFEPLGDAVRVRTGSVLGNDPLVGPQRAYDGDARTAWVASPGDQAPRLRLRWQEPRVLSRIEVVPGPDGVAPATVLLETPDETRRVDLRGSLGFFEPVRTDRVSLTFERTAVDGRVDGRSVSVAELGIQGLDDLRYRMPGEARTGGRCGFGPPVVVDGRVHDTRVVGTLEDALTGAPLEVRGCSGPATMGPGEHRIDTVATRQFLPVTTVLSPTGPGDAADEPVTGRTVRVETWDAGRRVVEVSPGDEAVLRIAENANPGWSATLDGRHLKSVAVDGWQQGYVVPAGRGGEVVVSFAPSGWYRAALAVGGLGALAVVLGAALSLAVGRRRGVVPLGVAPVAPGVTTPRPGWARAALLAAALATWLLGGVAVLAGAAVGSLLRWRGGSTAEVEERTNRRLAASAGLLVAAAGAVASVGVLADADLWPVADLVAGAGVGVAVACVLPALPARARSVAR